MTIAFFELDDTGIIRWEIDVDPCDAFGVDQQLRAHVDWQ